METLFKQVSRYELFTNLIPGALFCLLVDSFYGVLTFEANIIQWLFIYYFIGSIISRIGSLFIEPALKFFRIIHFSDYREYCKAKEKDTEIASLLIPHNMFRSMRQVFC